MRKFIVVEPSIATDVKGLKQIALRVCAPKRACVVVFLSERAAVPKNMPMTREQKRAVVAQFFRNPSSGREELLLKCKGNEPDHHKCLH